MRLFKTQMLDEAPRHAAGPYTSAFAGRYGRRRKGRRRPAAAPVDGDAAAIHHAERELLRRMCDYDIAA